jgi:hypothetical protein
VEAGQITGSLAPSRDPHREYDARLRLRQDQEARWARRWARLARARSALFGLIVVIAWLVDREAFVVKVWLAPPALLFEVLIWRRNRALQAWRQAARAAAFYKECLARLEHRWSGRGRAGTCYLDDNHPCALDLDLFGVGSLFELLCGPCSRFGEDTLAAWLRRPARADEVCRRQRAVADLAGRLDLREDLALVSVDLPPGAMLTAPAEWARNDKARFSPAER